MNDVTEEMHEAIGMRSCLANPCLSRRGTVVSMEADVGAGVAIHILRLLTGEVPMYTEVFTADLGDNAFRLGHAGYHDSGAADGAHPVRVIPDVEYKNSDPITGACTYFKYRPGPVTLVNSAFNGKKLQWTVAEGDSLPGPMKMEGNCHLYCRMHPPVREFYEKALQRGVSQHWVVIPGRRAGQLREVCFWLDIEYGEIAP